MELFNDFSTYEFVNLSYVEVIIIYVGFKVYSSPKLRIKLL